MPEYIYLQPLFHIKTRPAEYKKIFICIMFIKHMVMEAIINILILCMFVFLAFVLLRIEHLSKKVKLVIIVLLGLLIYVTAFGVISSSGINVATPRGIVNALYTYMGWIGKTATNLWDTRHDVGSIVGNAVKMNMTEESKKTKKK